MSDNGRRFTTDITSQKNKDEAFFLLYMAMNILDVSLTVAVIPSYKYINTEEGKSVTLPCQIVTSVKDKPQITWFKGQHGFGPIVLKVNTAGNIYIGSKYTGRLGRGSQANLVIISPELSDTGNYSCEALITVDVPPIDTGYVYVNVSRVRNQAVPQPTYIQYINLFWMGLCLLAANTLWINYALAQQAVINEYIKTTGISLCAVGLALCLACYMHQAVTWYRTTSESKRSRTDELKNPVEITESTGMISSDMVTTSKDV